MNRIKTVFDGFCKLELWDGGMPHDIVVVRTTDSISGLLWDQRDNRVLLVRQARAPMVREDNPDGMIVELVAGRFDRKVDPRQLFVDEAWEEAGVRISTDDVELLNAGIGLAPSPGILTERACLALVKIRPDQLVAGDRFGLASEGERTDRAWMSVGAFLAGPHADLRVYALARELETRILRDRLAVATEADEEPGDKWHAAIPVPSDDE